MRAACTTVGPGFSMSLTPRMHQCLPTFLRGNKFNWLCLKNGLQDVCKASGVLLPRLRGLAFTLEVHFSLPYMKLFRSQFLSIFLLILETLIDFPCQSAQHGWFVCESAECEDQGKSNIELFLLYSYVRHLFLPAIYSAIYSARFATCNKT